MSPSAKKFKDKANEVVASIDGFVDDYSALVEERDELKHSSAQLKSELAEVREELKAAHEEAEMWEERFNLLREALLALAPDAVNAERVAEALMKA